MFRNATRPINFGTKFKHWLVLRLLRKRPPALFECLCLNCGSVRSVQSCHLRSGASTNCGCVRGICKVKHGMCGSVEHVAWTGMKTRCYRKIMASGRTWSLGELKDAATLRGLRFDDGKQPGRVLHFALIGLAQRGIVEPTPTGHWRLRGKGETDKGDPLSPLVTN